MYLVLCMCLTFFMILIAASIFVCRDMLLHPLIFWLRKVSKRDWSAKVSSLGPGELLFCNEIAEGVGVLGK